MVKNLTYTDDYKDLSQLDRIERMINTGWMKNISNSQRSQAHIEGMKRCVEMIRNTVRIWAENNKPLHYSDMIALAQFIEARIKELEGEDKDPDNQAPDPIMEG